MRGRRWVLAVGVMLASPACAQASTQPLSQPSADAKPTAAPPKLVCKRIPVVGSNVGTERVCVVKGESEKSFQGQKSQPDDPRAQKGTNGGN